METYLPSHIPWVSMQDDHPPYDTRVLVFLDHGSWWDIGIEELTLKGDGKVYWQLADFDEVTHWAPLPNIPDWKASETANG